MLPENSSSGNHRKVVPFGFTAREPGGKDLLSRTGLEVEGHSAFAEGIIELILDRKEFADRPKFGRADAVVKAESRKKAVCWS